MLTRKYRTEIREKKVNETNKSKKNRCVFRSFHNTRRRIHQALKSDSKSCSTMDILGIDIKTHRKRIEYQTSPEVSLKSLEIDHVKHILSSDVYKVEQLRKKFIWISTQPSFKNCSSAKRN